MEHELPDLGEWHIVEKLGEGGQCAVYRVRSDADPGVERAVKFMFDRSPNALERFVAEAKLLMEIDHPNVLKVHALDADARPPWIAMQLLAGRDLDEERALGPIEPERAAQLIADVANGLDAVHQMGVRHRDIKPANIMVGHDGVPRLIDFGIAREIGKAHVTQAGMVIGTIAYMPPELFDSDDTRGVQDSIVADVYALGQTLCEILIGEPIYAREGNTTRLLALVMKEKLEKDCLDPRERRPQVPEELARVVRDATRQDPLQRIPSAAELERQLREWLLLRRDMNTAPVSRFDPSLLPPPTAPGAEPRAAVPAKASPKPAPKTGPKPAPKPPPPAEAAPPPPPEPTPRPEPLPSASSYEAPPPRRGGMLMFLASGVGTMSALALLVVGTALGLGALWMFRPIAMPFDPVATAAVVRPHVIEQKPSLQRCVLLLDEEKRAKEPEIVLAFQLLGGKPQDVTVKTGVGDKRVERCIADGVGRWTFAGAPDVPVELPIRLK